MLVWDFREIGNRLQAVRKKVGLTQSEMAERAGMSMRAYADIERGTVNTRLDTMLKICNALNITPDEVLVADRSAIALRQDALVAKLRDLPPLERNTALELLDVYMRSVTGL